MIDFPCHHCGFQFSVPQDMAGGTIQCPTCHVLGDVPTLSDLNAILPDGTYVIDQAPPPSPQRLAESFEAFDRNTYDVRGNEKDLRVTMHDIRRAGVEAPPAKAHPLQESPKYDPETGELIRPLTVAAREEDAADIPMAKPAIGYALPGVLHRVSPLRVYLELLTPGNAIVMSFIFLFHLLAELMAIVAWVMLPLVGMFALMVAIVAHYGCVIEDVGREEKDELPRPLRDLNIVEDFWWPFCNVAGALLICYGPAVYGVLHFNMEPRGRWFVGGSLFMLGTILLPAVLLTLITSGNVVNLRPDRVLGLIAASGRYYVLLVVAWIVGAGVYAIGILGLNAVAINGLMQWNGSVPKRYWVISVLLMMTGIYLLHAFCWQLGLLYRGKQAEFPWVLQHHERQTKRERVAIARAMRRRK